MFSRSQKQKSSANILTWFSSTFSLEELTNSSGGGPLPTVLALLTGTGLTLDLTSHQQALQVAGNLIAGGASFVDCDFVHVCHFLTINQLFVTQFLVAKYFFSIDEL